MRKKEIWDRKDKKKDNQISMATTLLNILFEKQLKDKLKKELNFV